MSSRPGPTPRVVFCCDAGLRRGVGHVMRSLGLAEEFARRGFAPLFVADVGELDWVHDEILRRGFGLLIGDATAETVLALAPTIAVIDAYELPSSVSKTVHAAGVTVVAIVDEGDGGHEADIYVNQNLGATAPVADVRYLAGLPYVLLRNDVIDRRPKAPADSSSDGPVRVVAVFGGTDPMGVAPIAARLLVESGAPFRATVVAASPGIEVELAGITPGHGQHIRVIGPTKRLSELLAGADLVVSAAGTSLCEMLCLGVATAVVSVVDNQRIGYEQVVAAGLAAGLGDVADLPADASLLGRLLREPSLRQRYARAAWSTVDGLGRVRVVDAVLRLIAPGRTAPTDCAES